MKNKNIDLLLKIVLAVSVIVLIFVSVFKDNKPNNSVLYLMKNTDWKPLTEKESYYTSFMYDVINHFSYQQDKHYKKSMTRDQRIKYVNENLKLAKVFGWGYFDVPIIHQLESSFNPWEDHLYSENGLGGIMYGTAKMAYYYCQRYMPRNLWRKVDFTLEKPEDLIDPINALKATYIILWWEYKTYDGKQDWAVSGYHWGGFLYKHWHKAEGDFPEKFIIFTKFGRKELNPKAYYFAWCKLRIAYENGDLEAGKYIQEKWEKLRNSMKNDEYNYRVVKNRVKSLRKEIKKLKEVDEIRKHHEERLDKQVNQMNRDLKRIAREANKVGWTKKLYKDLKDRIKKWLGRNKKVKK